MNSNNQQKTDNEIRPVRVPSLSVAESRPKEAMTQDRASRPLRPVDSNNKTNLQAAPYDDSRISRPKPPPAKTNAEPTRILSGIKRVNHTSVQKPARVRSQANQRERSRIKPQNDALQRQIKAAEDEVLAVIVDQRNGYTFYVSIIDNFRYKGIEYAVMYNYRAEDFQRSMPEILIMRTYRDAEKQYFTSIRDQKELDMIFDVFYERFQQSL